MVPLQVLTSTPGRTAEAWLTSGANGTEWQRSNPAPGWVRLSALLQGSALLEALPYDAVAPLLCDQERRTTLTALALLALKFSSTVARRSRYIWGGEPGGGRGQRKS